MNVEVIRRRLSKQGPHIIRTSDGHKYPVPHPDFVLVGRYNIVIEDQQGMIDILDPLHVVAIRRAPAIKPKQGSAQEP